MKKSSLLLVLFAAAACAFLINCGSDKTEIGWVNGTGVGGETISQIKWYDSTDNENASWIDTLAQGAQSGLQEISKLNGYAKGFSTEESAVVSIYANYDGTGIGTVSPTSGIESGTSTRYTIKSAK